jgi:hypothetical protein
MPSLEKFLPVKAPPPPKAKTLGFNVEMEYKDMLDDLCDHYDLSQTDIFRAMVSQEHAKI